MLGGAETEAGTRSACVCVCVCVWPSSVADDVAGTTAATTGSEEAEVERRGATATGEPTTAEAGGALSDGATAGATLATGATLGGAEVVAATAAGSGMGLGLNRSATEARSRISAILIAPRPSSIVLQDEMSKVCLLKQKLTVESEPYLGCKMAGPRREASVEAPAGNTASSARSVAQ